MITINFKRTDKRSPQITAEPSTSPSPHCPFLVPTLQVLQSAVLWSGRKSSGHNTVQTVHLFVDLVSMHRQSFATHYKYLNKVWHMQCLSIPVVITHSELWTLQPLAYPCILGHRKMHWRTYVATSGSPDHWTAQGRHHILGNKRFGFFGEISLERYLTDVSKRTATRTRKLKNMKENIRIFSNCQSEYLFSFLLRIRSNAKLEPCLCCLAHTRGEAFGRVGRMGE